VTAKSCARRLGPDQTSNFAAQGGRACRVRARCLGSSPGSSACRERRSSRARTTPEVAVPAPSRLAQHPDVRHRRQDRHRRRRLGARRHAALALSLDRATPRVPRRTQCSCAQDLQAKLRRPRSRLPAAGAIPSGGSLPISQAPESTQLTRFSRRWTPSPPRSCNAPRRARRRPRRKRTALSASSTALRAPPAPRARSSQRSPRPPAVAGRRRLRKLTRAIADRPPTCRHSSPRRLLASGGTTRRSPAPHARALPASSTTPAPPPPASAARHQHDTLMHDLRLATQQLVPAVRRLRPPHKRRARRCGRSRLHARAARSSAPAPVSTLTARSRARSAQCYANSTHCSPTGANVKELAPPPRATAQHRVLRRRRTPSGRPDPRQPVGARGTLTPEQNARPHRTDERRILAPIDLDTRAPTPTQARHPRQPADAVQRHLSAAAGRRAPTGEFSPLATRSRSVDTSR